MVLSQIVVIILISVNQVSHIILLGGVNQEFMEIQLNQYRCLKKYFQSPRDLRDIFLHKKVEYYIV